MPTLLPKSSVSVRPRMAVEVRSTSVVAARADDGVGLIAQVAVSDLPPGCVLPSFVTANVVDAAALTAALRRAVGQVAVGKGGDLTLIVPDAAVRVFLLDFDELPSRRDDALGVLRFRLSKLLPIPTDETQISYQLTGRRDGALQVLVVAIPKSVLAEYESAVRDAGFEPGAVLPSSLAVAAALDDVGQTASLFVNGSAGTLTTAIVRRGDLLLHRTIDFRTGEPNAATAAEASVHTMNDATDGAIGDAFIDATGDATDDAIAGDLAVADRPMLSSVDSPAEFFQAVSVASAYYEDTLGAPPPEILLSGEFSIDALDAALDPLRLSAKDVVQPGDLRSTSTAQVPRALLAGVRGALKI